MKKVMLLATLFISLQVKAQYSYIDSLSAEELITHLKGEGVTVVNPYIRCHDSMQGSFAGDGTLGLDSGILLSNTALVNVFKPYDYNFKPRIYAYHGIRTLMDTLYTPTLFLSWGDYVPPPIMTAYSCMLAMDVVPHNDNIKVDFTMADALHDGTYDMTETDTLFLGTEGYPFGFSVWRCYPRTNVVGIFISGPGIADTQNLAVLPGSVNGKTIPVNAYTLTATQEMLEDRCISADPSTDTLLFPGMPYNSYLTSNEEGILDPNFAYPGISVPITGSIEVNPCDTYRIVIGVTKTANIHNLDVSGATLMLSRLRSEGPLGSCSDSGTAIGGPEGNIGLEVAPNPFTQRLRLVAGSEFQDREMRLSLTDLSGREQLQAQGRLATLNKALEDKAEHLQGGMYLLHVWHEEGGKVWKVVRQE